MKTLFDIQCFLKKGYGINFYYHNKNGFAVDIYDPKDIKEWFESIDSDEGEIDIHAIAEGNSKIGLVEAIENAIIDMNSPQEDEED